MQGALMPKMEEEDEEGETVCVFSMSLLVSKLGPQLCVFQWVLRTFLSAATESEGSLVVHS